MIDFKQIEAFVWIAELGSFRAAADKLNTTQPAISQRIAAMEAIMNVRLFERGSRGIKLTEKGQELVSHSIRMLDLRSEMMRVAQEQNAIRGTLRLGVAETLVHTWLHLLIDALHHKYPALVVDLHVDTSHVLRTQLHSHQIDLALLVGVSHEPNEHSIHLCDYELAWVASPVLRLHNRRISMAELANYPIITYPAISAPYKNVRSALLSAGIKNPRIFGSASLSTIIHMTHSGMGPSVLAPVLIRDELTQGKLCLLDTDHPINDINFYAAWIDSPDSKTAHAVANLAAKIARSHKNGTNGAGEQTLPILPPDIPPAS